MDDTTLERLLGIFDRRSWEINRQYLIKAAKHLKDIGQLPPSDIHRMAEMRRMNTSLREISREMAALLQRDEADIDAVLAQVAKENDWAARTMLAYGGEKVPLLENEALLRLLEATSRATHETFQNLSNTTIDDSVYRHSIDRAIHAVTTGVSDYGSEIRRCVRELSENGLRVRYPSGRTMRLDSAVRMNVLDGARHVNAESMRILGEGYGADGVEIDAHMLCAEDHLPYQGMQYTLEEFDDIQDGLMRPFGEWNCRHNIHYIVMGVSPRNYTDEELAEMKQFSTEQIEIDGVSKTRYEWSQTMRRLETKARYQNDETEALKAIGDKSGARMSDERSKMIVDAYDKVCKGAGLQPQYNRMYVGRASYLTNQPQRSIINTKLDSTGHIANPMDTNRYNSMNKGLSNKFGVSVFQAKGDDLRFLNTMGAEAIYDGVQIMHRDPVPSASGLFEEVIHMHQAHLYGELSSNDMVELSAREIAAQDKLLKHGKAYGFTEDDYEDIRTNHEKWAAEFTQLTGKEYDPNDKESPYYRGF